MVKMVKLDQQKIKEYAKWVNEVHDLLYSALAQTEGLVNDPVIREIITNPQDNIELIEKLSGILSKICDYYDSFEASLYTSCLGDFDTLMLHVRGEFERV